MALETASYVANLVTTNPDDADAVNAGDDHLRLIKAVLVRTFPKVDGAISLSQAQVMFLGDVSSSVQAQINLLRDGSATVNNALYANSASVAAFIGTLPAARVMDLQGFQQVFTSIEPFRLTTPNAFIPWVYSGVRQGYFQYDSLGLAIVSEINLGIRFYTNNLLRVTINADGTLTIPGLITGTITNATNAVNASLAASASFATVAASAVNASFAATCTSASSAATLAGLSPDVNPNADTIARRTSAGDLLVRYLNQGSAGSEAISIGQVFAETNADGYLRKVTLALLGSYLETRNITGKSGTAKTLASGSGPPSLSGSTNGDVWYYY